MNEEDKQDTAEEEEQKRAMIQQVLELQVGYHFPFR